MKGISPKLLGTSEKAQNQEIGEENAMAVEDINERNISKV